MARAGEEEGSRSGHSSTTPVMTAGGGGGRKPATWRRVGMAAQEAAAHALLLCFTALLALKLDGLFSRSWWVLFIPLWLFHAVVARGRFSLPAPLSPRSRQWVPCHSIVATPLLVAFELLLCVYLESINGHGEPLINLKLVFLPLLALEIITLIDNFRMCGALMPGNGETIIDEAIWESLPHFWVAISMVFLLAATSLMLLKLCGDAGALGWWDLFITFGISQCFAFLVCTRWSNPMIGRQSMHGIPNSSAMDIGGHILILPILIFQVLLCMHLEGTPSNARFIPVRAIFSPILLLHVATVFFTVWRLMEMLVILLKNGTINEGYLLISSKIGEFFMLIHHGSRLISWWSIDEGNKEEQARLYYDSDIGYNTFCNYPPEMVKEMPKKVLVKEVQRLQLALGEQTEIAKKSQREYDRLKNERILCRICFERDICIVLLPCRHHILCEACFERCRLCPICRVPIEKKMSLHDAVNLAN